MIRVKETNSVLAKGGVYFLLRSGKGVTALVDADLPVRMPRLKAALDTVGQALDGVASRDCSVSVKFDRWR